MDNIDIRMNEEYDHIDELTGLHNLNGVLSHLQGHDKHSASSSSVIIYLNVMNFKSFNQRYGFVGGNDFLRGMAAEIKDIFSDSLPARAGADQFIILANSIEEKEIIERLDRLRESVLKYSKGLKMKFKAGVYVATGEEDDPVIMVDRAKIACDDIIKVYDKDFNVFDEKLAQKNEMKQYVIDNFETAFKEKYFKVYYQKEVRALTGKVCGYEALARWQDPEKGIISPAIFIEVLEDTHLIHKLDITIIEQVCADLREDIDSGFAVEPISVNLSQLDFELCDIKSEIDKCRAKYDIPTNLIHIEITESALSMGSDFLEKQIEKFRNGGYEVWMDDFGSGYSSFNNLKNYDFDVLKIDMDFLRSFDNNKKTKVILSTIVSMAKELGIHTLAEGVETKEQYDFLKRIGCEKLQGYLFGKPTPADAFVREVDCSFDVCEDFSMAGYYDAIGEVNVLGSTPLRPKTMEVFNNLPITMVEVDDEGGFKTIYLNNAYMQYLSSLGLSDEHEADARTKIHGLREKRDFQLLMDRAEQDPSRRSDGDLVFNGNVVNLKLRFLARHEDKRTFAVVARNISMHEDSDIADSLHTAIPHVLNQYFRVDLYDEDGTVDNIFLNTDQLAVADNEPDAVKAVEIYSNIYLVPQDRERFRKFYDITTVRDRMEKLETDYVVDYFRSAIPGDRERLQMYLILPFYHNGRWKYLSLCRYADEIKSEILK